MGRLNGKIAIITGAARGIGAATARIFVEQGADVILTDLRAEEGKALADDLGSKAHYIKHDVSKAEDWSAVISMTKCRFGEVSVLVNNAGIGQSGAPVHECSEADYRRIIEIDQISVFLGMKAVIPSMRQVGSGSIINISSTAGLVGIPSSIAYTAAKFAVTGMTKAAALDLGPLGIRVNSVHPGLINTQMVAEADPAQQELVRSFAKSLPLGRTAEPCEIAEVIVFLASEGASFCTGSSFSADGGWTAS